MSIKIVGLVVTYVVQVLGILFLGWDVNFIILLLCLDVLVVYLITSYKLIYYHECKNIIFSTVLRIVFKLLVYTIAYLLLFVLIVPVFLLIVGGFVDLNIFWENIANFAVMSGLIVFNRFLSDKKDLKSRSIKSLDWLESVYYSFGNLFVLFVVAILGIFIFPILQTNVNFMIYILSVMFVLDIYVTKHSQNELNVKVVRLLEKIFR
jgi:hypothetical protein